MSDESIIRELEQATTLKLSAALRIGAAIRPQVLGNYFRDGGSCAIGAIYEGTFHEQVGGGMDLSRDLRKAYPALNHLTSHPLLDRMNYYTVADCIMGLNDQLRWTRENIADWLESKGL